MTTPIQGPLLVYDWTTAKLAADYPALLSACAAAASIPEPPGIVSTREAPVPFVLDLGCVATIQTLRAPAVVSQGIDWIATEWVVRVILSDSAGGGDPETLARIMRVRQAALANTFLAGTSNAAGVSYKWQWSQFMSDPPLPRGSDDTFAQAIGGEFTLTLLEAIG